MTKPDKQYTDLTSYLIKQWTWAQATIRQHTERITMAAAASDDDNGRTVLDYVASTESMFEAAA